MVVSGLLFVARYVMFVVVRGVWFLLLVVVGCCCLLLLFVVVG